MADHAQVSVGRMLLALVPTLVAMLAVVIVNLPVTITGGLMPAPMLALIPVYFWSLVRPDLMPPVAALGIGLLEDLLSGGPPGLWAAGFLAAYAFTDRQRDSLAGLSGFGAVMGFAAAMFIGGGVAYALASLVMWRFAPLGSLLLECAVTVVLYPPIATAIGWLHRPIIGPMRNDI